MNKKDKIAVIGAGVGGLATAARLAFKKYDVDIYERLSHCGGRANIIEDRGFKFDMGPSFVLMPDFFNEVFLYCQRDIRDYLDLMPLDVSYKIFFANGKKVTVFRDSDKTKQEIERIEKGSSLGFDKFIEKAGQIYSNVKPLLYKSLSVKDMFNPLYWPLIPKIEVFQSYWGLAKKFFKSNELCFLFTFEAMFIGVSPFKAPAFYSVISYADHVQKIYHPRGGMYQIPKALEAIAQEEGVKINYGKNVDKVIHNKGNYELVMNEDSYVYDKVVINADYAYSQETLLGRKLSKYDYSCSVFLIYLGLKKKVKGLEHHNLFFSSDLEKNLSGIFKGKPKLEEWSFYVHVPTVTDNSLADPGKEIIYILVPVANMSFGNTLKQTEEKIRKYVLDKIKQVVGINLEPWIEVEHRFYPRDFVNRYNVKNGATFGLGHSFLQSAFFRPTNRDKFSKDLYYVGASTQPGGGLPPVIASSRIVADLIIDN